MTYNLDLALRSSRERPRALVLLAGAAVAVALLASLPADAKVFLGKKDALAWAFPDAEVVDEETFLLNDEQMALLKSAGGHRDSRLVTVYTARRAGVLQGHALIDIHNVRTHPEAFLIVLSPFGEVQRLRVLAFHEPLEYLPPDRWLRQFPGSQSNAPLRVGHDVHGIAGSTLTAQAVTGGIRRAIALYRVLLTGD
jgi:hypothetical protein